MVEYLVIIGFYLAFGSTTLLILSLGIGAFRDGLGVETILFVLIGAGFVLLCMTFIGESLEIPGWY